MNQNKQQPINQIQISQCTICQLQPIPESIQYIPFIILQIILLFLSIKLVIITVLISYCFAKCSWFCPQCKRQVDIGTEVQGISENIILRMGNCMIMLSKLKFRIISACIVIYISYLTIIEFKERPKSNIQLSWTSLATNAGYQAFLQNAFKANTLYSQYPQLGQWTLAGIFLRQQVIQVSKLSRVYVKMNPTQFKNPMTQDIVLIVTAHTQKDHGKLQIGDIIQFSGQWEGRQGSGHLFKFLAMKLKKKGIKMALEEVKLLGKAQRFIRVHEEQRPNIQDNKKIEIKDKI